MGFTFTDILYYYKVDFVSNTLTRTTHIHEKDIKWNGQGLFKDIVVKMLYQHPNTINSQI